MAHPPAKNSHDVSFCPHRGLSVVSDPNGGHMSETPDNILLNLVICCNRTLSATESAACDKVAPEAPNDTDAF